MPVFFIRTGSGHQKYIFLHFSIAPFFVHLIVNQFDHRTHHQNAYTQQYNLVLYTQIKETLLHINCPNNMSTLYIELTAPKKDGF